MGMNTAEQKDPILEGAAHLGKYWAALRGDKVISTISMRIPNNVDFKTFRIKAIAALEMLGDVRAGDLFEKGDEQYFMPRPHKHQNRSKKRPTVGIKPLKLSKSNNRIAASN